MIQYIRTETYHLSNTEFTSRIFSLHFAGQHKQPVY